MVSAQTVVIIGGLALFVLAGGVGVSKTAFAQVQTDLKTLSGGISSRVKKIKANNDKFFFGDPPLDRAGEKII